MAEGKPPRPDGAGRFDQPFRKRPAAPVRLPSAEALPEPPPVPMRDRKDTVKVTVAPPSALPAPTWREEVTGRGIPHPLSDHPPRSVSPLPFELDESPSKVHSSREVARLKAEVQDQKDRADAAERAQLELQKRRAPVDSEPPRKRSHAVLKALGVILGAVLVTVSGYFGIDLKTRLEPKVEATKAVQAAAQADLDKAVTRVSQVEQYLRLKAARDACLRRQERDAIARGTGYDLVELERGGTEWAEQSSPSRHKPTGAPTYYTKERCPDEPATP